MREDRREGGSGVSGPAGDHCSLLAPQVLQEPLAAQAGLQGEEAGAASVWVRPVDLLGAEPGDRCPGALGRD